MADYINNEAAADGYIARLSLGPDFEATSAVITVANNPALMQFAIGKLGSWRWTDEREFFAIPQSFKVGNIIGVRFRNALAGQTARVLAVLAGEHQGDPIFESGIPFTGVLASNGTVTNPGAGSMQLIQDQLLAGAQASIDFQNIPQTFAHLLLILQGRGDGAAASMDVFGRFNGDPGANYDWQSLRGTAAAPAAAEVFADVGFYLGAIPAAAAGANLANQITCEMHNYSGVVFNKTANTRNSGKIGVASTNLAAFEIAGFWRNVAAINRLTLILGAAGNFVAGTRATLYGLGVT